MSRRAEFGFEPRVGRRDFLDRNVEVSRDRIHVRDVSRTRFDEAECFGFPKHTAAAKDSLDIGLHVDPTALGMCAVKARQICSTYVMTV